VNSAAELTGMRDDESLKIGAGYVGKGRRSARRHATVAARSCPRSRRAWAMGPAALVTVGSVGTRNSRSRRLSALYYWGGMRQLIRRALSESPPMSTRMTQDSDHGLGYTRTSEACGFQSNTINAPSRRQFPAARSRRRTTPAPGPGTRVHGIGSSIL
jgi:hypothetical protein